jgi:hypothetical protein
MDETAKLSPLQEDVSKDRCPDSSSLSLPLDDDKVRHLRLAKESGQATKALSSDYTYFHRFTAFGKGVSGDEAAIEEVDVFNGLVRLRDLSPKGHVYRL